MDLTLIFGTVGAILILVAFLMRNSKTRGVGTPTYQVLNAIGAGVLVWYAWTTGVWPFLILNGVWLFDALRALVKRLL